MKTLLMIKPEAVARGLYGDIIAHVASGDQVTIPIDEDRPHMVGHNLRAYIEDLMPDVLEGRIEPGRVFDRTVSLDQVADGYRAMADREALKVLIQP